MIKNIKNNKVYIGISNNVQARLKRHLRELKQGKHKNEKLQNSFNKYGEENFEFNIIEYMEIELLEDKEKELIKQYNSVDNGYNIEYGGNYNKVINISTKKKQSIKRIGEKNANAIITDEVALEILKQLLDLSNTVDGLANRFNVPIEVVNNLQQGRSYKHLLKEHRQEIRDRHRTIDRLRLNKALKSVQEGMSQNVASKIYKVSRNTLRRELKKIS